MFSSTLKTTLLAFLAAAAAACSAAPGESAESELASSRQALVRGDCRPFDGFTGALGAATVDCLGRVGTYDYVVQPDAAGNPTLRRGFDSCPMLDQMEGPAKLLQIDQLLSIQEPQRQHVDQRKAYPDALGKFPNAVTCVAEAFLTAQKRLREQGITTCPTFKPAFIIGDADNEAYAKFIVSRLPKPVERDTPGGVKLVFPEGSFGPKFRRPKEYPIYTVAFDQQPPPMHPCIRTGSCAKECSSVFAGFYLARFGKFIVADPDWWFDTTVRPFNAASPYSRVNGYYHPMAAAGDGPGALYGAIARAMNPRTAPMGSLREQCTYWTPDYDMLGELVEDVAGVFSGFNAVSRCQPY